MRHFAPHGRKSDRKRSCNAEGKKCDIVILLLTLHCRADCFIILQMLLQQGQHFQEQIKYEMLTRTCSSSRLKRSHCSSAVEGARVAEDGERGGSSTHTRTPPARGNVLRSSHDTQRCISPCARETKSYHRGEDDKKSDAFECATKCLIPRNLELEDAQYDPLNDDRATLAHTMSCIAERRSARRPFSRSCSLSLNSHNRFPFQDAQTSNFRIASESTTWRKFWSASKQRPYYQHVATKQVVWEIPESICEPRKQEELNLLRYKAFNFSCRVLIKALFDT